MEIERIEDWVGQTVVDRDGEKVGKLEDVFYGAGTRDAVAGSVKTGLLGRKLSVVSLTGATVARDHVKLSFSKDRVKDAPQAESGADLDETQRGELERHFDMRLPGGSLESASARAEREKRAEETASRAEELERVAAEKSAEAKRHEETATAAERERDEARREAEEARRDVEGPR